VDLRKNNFVNVIVEQNHFCPYWRTGATTASNYRTDEHCDQRVPFQLRPRLHLLVNNCSYDVKLMRLDHYQVKSHSVLLQILAD
jgi:hypothetical protein